MTNKVGVVILSVLSKLLGSASPPDFFQTNWLNLRDKLVSAQDRDRPLIESLVAR